MFEFQEEEEEKREREEQEAQLSSITTTSDNLQQNSDGSDNLQQNSDGSDNLQIADADPVKSGVNPQSIELTEIDSAAVGDDNAQYKTQSSAKLSDSHHQASAETASGADTASAPTDSSDH